MLRNAYTVRQRISGCRSFSASGSLWEASGQRLQATQHRVLHERMAPETILRATVCVLGDALDALADVLQVHSVALGHSGTASRMMRSDAGDWLVITATCTGR